MNRFAEHVLPFFRKGRFWIRCRNLAIQQFSIGNMVLQCQVRMSDCKRKCMLRIAHIQVRVKWFCDWNVNKFLFPLLLHPDDYLMRCMIHSCLRYLWIQNSRQKERQFYKLIWMDDAHFTSLILYNLPKQKRGSKNSSPSFRARDMKPERADGIWVEKFSFQTKDSGKQ